MQKNIYQNIDANKYQSLFLMLGFTLFFVFIGWFLSIYYEDTGFGLIGVALIFSGVSSLISYYYSDKLVLMASGARKVEPLENRGLHNLVDNMSIASGIPKPDIYVIDDTAMNAFATGRDPQHAVICFTTGIISYLDKRELEGVIAHEMSHIGNYDIRLMSLVSILVGSITLLADIFTRGMFYGSRRKSRVSGEISGIILILGLGLVLLSPIIATLIKLAISRKREFLADSTAALITRYPQGLANALKKLAQDTQVLEAANGATAHLYIASPIRANFAGFLSNMFNTHPPIEERIKRLEIM